MRTRRTTTSTCLPENVSLDDINFTNSAALALSSHLLACNHRDIQLTKAELEIALSDIVDALEHTNLYVCKLMESEK